ncbi:MAG: tetratricopeptide repeat protein [Myxococcota bacterium]
MQTIQDAWAALQRGDRVQAELVATQLVQSARVTFGEDTPGHANALAEWASLLVAMGDLNRAIAALRQASAVRGTDDPSVRAELTHAMNLGELLAVAGSPEEAVAVLEEGLVRRRAFYGPHHPGTGYGLQSLADAQMALGAFDKAYASATEARAVFEEHDHPERIATTALLAEIQVARGFEPEFGDVLQGPHDDVVNLVRASQRRADRGRHPRRMLHVVTALHRDLQASDRALEHRAGLLTTMSNLARLASDPEARLRALQLLQAHYDALDLAVNAHEATLALALAASDANQLDTTEHHYQDALERVSSIHGLLAADRRSQTLRNFGLWLVEVGRGDEGIPLLEAATDVADAVLRGRAQCALGVALQHRGEAERAERELTRALESLPPADADSLVAHRHLGAIRDGTHCGCGTRSQGLAETLFTIVAPDLPKGLLDRLEFDEQGQLQVQLLRQATDDEIGHLWRVLRQGLARLSQGVRNRR